VKILLAAHGYPPELAGGTEREVAQLARELQARGHAVTVLAGTLRTQAGLAESQQDGVRVLRLARGDLYFDHWHKSSSPAVQRAVRELLARERPDVLHVHHWLRLTRELVFLAAQARVPALVSLHDAWTSCPLTFRVRPDTQAACDAQVGPHPCVRCAGRVPPFTPWVPVEAQYMLLAERQRDLLRELTLARAVVAPSRAHADALRRHLGLAEPPWTIEVESPAGPQPSAVSFERRPPRALGRLVLASFGALTPIKGVDLVCDALRALAAELPVELELAGDESDARHAAELRQRCAGLAVRFHGAYDAERLAEHPLSRAQVFVSGSRAAESWGRVLDEARALGLVSVLPRAGAFAERADEARGALLYEPGSAASLAQALRRLWHEPELWSTLAARVPREAARSPGALAAAWEARYAAAIAAGAPAVPAAGAGAGGAGGDWYSERLAEFAVEQWDRSLSATAPRELGLEPR